MTTNAENITLMMLRLGSRSSPTLRGQLVLELNKTIRELERGATKPWFMEDRLDGTLVAGQDWAPMPDTFLEEVEEGHLRIQNNITKKWCQLVKLDYDRMQHQSENCDPAVPVAYAMRGEKLFFAPAPVFAYPYRWEAFVRTPPVPDDTAETTNKWLLEFFDYTSLTTLNKVARLHIRAQEIMRDIAQPLKEAADAYWRACEARQQANRNYEQE